MADGVKAEGIQKVFGACSGRELVHSLLLSPFLLEIIQPRGGELSLPQTL